MIGYSREGMACTPNTLFTDDSFEFTLPDDADSGQAFTKCVQLTSGDCMEMASSEFISESIKCVVSHSKIFFCTVPGRTTTSNEVVVSGTNVTITVNPPITKYRPDQLQIIVSLTPNDTAPVVADFSASYQYTVMFSGLMPGTSYSYTVRVVRCSDMTDVVEPFVGSFIIVVLCKLINCCEFFLCLGVHVQARYTVYSVCVSVSVWTAQGSMKCK